MTSPTTLTEIILPDQANHYGTLFGGRGLSLMARAAFVTASRHARAKVVLAACHEARFEAPVPLGSLFLLKATLAQVGRTSMRIDVSGHCEHPEESRCTSVSQATFTMVAVDDAGRPVPVPPMEAEAR